jgi:ABC-type sugar transport system ATPase subunit
VLELVRSLRNDGRGVVIISHNLEEVFEVADRITVLRLGRYVGTYDADTVSREQLVSYMTGAAPGAPSVSGAAAAPQPT